MKVKNKVVFQNLQKLFEKSDTVELSSSGKWVIFSDLHMGDGSSTDDFRRNAQLFLTTLNAYYQPRGYSLVLNGDVEELQKFSLKRIERSWPQVYRAFDVFAGHQRLIKTFGNHDLQLSYSKDPPGGYDLREAFKFRFNDHYLFVFHGHQASKRFQQHNDIIGFALRYFATPLRIRNYSVSHSSRKQYNIEKRVYQFSANQGIASIIGHTHRPLFESLHKVERLKYKIEQLCREYSQHNQSDQEVEESIKLHKADLMRYFRTQSDHNFQNYVYDTVFNIPCVFNSGCVIGKRGMTCIEIENGQISLVHWFDTKISKKYLRNTGYSPEELKGTDYFRMVVNKEDLDYIFTRIKFLS